MPSRTSCLCTACRTLCRTARRRARGSLVALLVDLSDLRLGPRAASDLVPEACAGLHGISTSRPRRRRDHQPRRRADPLISARIRHPSGVFASGPDGGALGGRPGGGLSSGASARKSGTASATPAPAAADDTAAVACKRARRGNADLVLCVRCSLLRATGELVCCSVLRVRELVNRVAIVEAGRPARRVDGRPTRSAATAAAPVARTARSSPIAAHRGVARVLGG